MASAALTPATLKGDREAHYVVSEPSIRKVGTRSAIPANLRRRQGSTYAATHSAVEPTHSVIGFLLRHSDFVPRLGRVELR